MAVDHRGGEPEVGEQVVAHLEGDLVVVLAQIHNLIAEDRLALESQQGKALVEARVQADHGVMADLKSRVRGEDAEFVRHRRRPKPPPVFHWKSVVRSGSVR